MTTGHGESACGRGASDEAWWTVGADGLGTHLWSGDPVEMPAGRLHAVTGEGLLLGRAVCLAPVVLLDPVDWRWPDDGCDEWPLCWICHALTR